MAVNWKTVAELNDELDRKIAALEEEVLRKERAIAEKEEEIADLDCEINQIESKIHDLGVQRDVAAVVQRLISQYLEAPTASLRADIESARLVLRRVSASEVVVVLPGDRVFHIREPEACGTVTSVDRPLDYDIGRACCVKWDDHPRQDTQWLSKLMVVDE